MSNYPDNMNHAALDVKREQIVAAQIEQDAANERIDHTKRYMPELQSLSFEDAHARCDDIGDEDEDFCVNAVRVLWPEFDVYYTAWKKQVYADRLVRNQPFNHQIPLYLQDYATKHAEPPVKRPFPLGEVLALFFFCAAVGVILGFMVVMS